MAKIDSNEQLINIAVNAGQTQHSDEVILSDGESEEDDRANNENTSLLTKCDHESDMKRCVNFKVKFQRTVCLKSSSAIMVLTWAFLASMLHWIFIDPSCVVTPLTIRYITVASENYYFIMIVGSAYVYFAILQLFYPLAGYLADVRYGRYKCVITSLWCFPGSSILIGLGTALIFASLFTLLLEPVEVYDYVIVSVMVAFFGPPVLSGIALFFCSIVAFNANVIQFGLDQLHDRPTEHLILFIHWYVILSYTGTELIRAQTSTLTSVCYSNLNYYWLITSIVSLLLVVAYFLVLVLLCVVRCKRHTWFLADNSSRNPYVLVYKVVSFARKHKVPIRRSAFTYCEDELPSRLDLGKSKYGGPFTTEQVEDVKVLLGIIKVLFSFGPFFTVERSINFLLPALSKHLSGIYFPCSFSNDIFPSIAIISLLVLYVVFVRPHVLYYIPSMLKRIGIGATLMVMPTLCFFVLDTVAHKTSHDTVGCFLNTFVDDYSYITETHSLGLKPYFLFIPLFSSISGSMIFYIAVYEFIYSQSPHSMKGLMIGTFFAIRGLFQLIGALVLMFPFAGWNLSSSFPSCGFVYYLVNSIVALLGIVVYMWVARKYQPRQRDEPDNVYRYAEEYYAKAQDESNYDGDSYDNLNVHTIG